MSGFAGQRSRPWMGDATPSEQAAGDVREDSGASSSTKDLGSSSAISFGFAATAILISMFLLMAIFEHLIKPGWASSRGSHDGNDGDVHGHGQSSHPGWHLRNHGPPDKFSPSPKKEPVVAAELTVLMPGSGIRRSSRSRRLCFLAREKGCTGLTTMNYIAITFCPRDSLF